MEYYRDLQNEHLDSLYKLIQESFPHQAADYAASETTSDGKATNATPNGNLPETSSEDRKEEKGLSKTEKKDGVEGDAPGALADDEEDDDENNDDEEKDDEKEDEQEVDLTEKEDGPGGGDGTFYFLYSHQTTQSVSVGRTICARSCSRSSQWKMLCARYAMRSSSLKIPLRLTARLMHAKHFINGYVFF